MIIERDGSTRLNYKERKKENRKDDKYRIFYHLFTYEEYLT